MIKKIKNIKAVIFDLDGVIINSENIHKQAKRQIFNKYNLSSSEMDKGEFYGMRTIDIFNTLIHKYHRDDLSSKDLRKECGEIYRKLAAKKLKVFPQVLDLINFLQNKFQLALATSCGPLNLKFSLDKFNLQKKFKVVVISDMVKYGKPHPEIYKLTIKKLGLKPNECLVIEDAVKGVESAKSAGATVIAITNSFPEEKLKQADLIVKNFNEIKNLLT